MDKKPQIFVDTSYFKAFLDEKDDFSTQALDISLKLESEKVHLVTSNYVLDESFTLLRKRCGLEFAFQLREKVVTSSTFKIFRITAKDEADAWEWFENKWSDLSYTDCTSFALMKRLGLDRVATFDEHFFRAGFEVVR